VEKIEKKKKIKKQKKWCGFFLFFAQKNQNNE